MVGKFGEVVLMDWGVAKLMPKEAQPGASQFTTQDGALIGTSKFLTTVLMKAHTGNGNVVKVAIGYVRVSTLEQASEGVSLDAQRDKIRAYCKFNNIKLIGITTDEGVSGGTLDRPGLQEALWMLKRGRANTLLVIKLDRLTRSVRDLCWLVDEYFAHERYHLLSVCGLVNTHNAAGRMLMLNLANYAQFEREIISERTYEAMQQLKAQGVKMGHPPYGYAFSQMLDDNGRRKLMPVDAEQVLINRMAALHDSGFKFVDIARQLTGDGIRARRGGEWRGCVISTVLQREGRYAVRPHREYAPRVPIVRDKTAAAARARELRAEGLSLRAIGTRLRKEGLLPPRARTWHAASVQHLLRYHGAPNSSDAARRAIELRAQGLSFSEVGLRLSSEGHVPSRGGFWYPSRVAALLRSVQSAPTVAQPR
jgi:DNA invertase Pin-like site-specific DNA recombinase